MTDSPDIRLHVRVIQREGPDLGKHVFIEMDRVALSLGYNAVDT